MGVPNAARGLFELGGIAGSAMSLRALGMNEDQIDAAAKAALKDPYWNPRPLEYHGIRAMLAAAWRGDPPASA
jgi:alcohol dehydrogenase class IV